MQTWLFWHQPQRDEAKSLKLIGEGGSQNFPDLNRGNIIVVPRLTECDCQIVNWPLAIPIKRVISLKSHFVMSIIYSAHWVTVWIGALGLAGYWHASFCLQSLWVDEWVSVFSNPNMFLFLLCHFLSFLTFLHHGMASLCQCMLSSAVCKYMSASHDVFWCLLKSECYIIAQLRRNVLEGKLSSFTYTHTSVEQEETEILFSSQCN